MRTIFLASLSCLLTLMSCALILVHRVKRMRLARRELQRREAMRAAELLQRLSDSFNTVQVTLTCDVAPAIEGLAKAFASCSKAARAVSCARFDAHDVRAVIEGGE